MGRIYLETSAIRKLTDYSYDVGVYTSIFVLFELTSGIGSEKEFSARKACLKRIFEQEIIIKPKMVDQIMFEFAGVQGYRENFFNTLYAISKDVIRLNSFEEFSKLKITFTHEKPIIHSEEVTVLSWLENWDNKISDMRNKSANMFHENKEFIIELHKKDGLKGIAQYYWSLYEDNKFDERRIGGLSAFRSEKDAKQTIDGINQMFSQYNFKLFSTAQAVVFAKAKYLDGGLQDKNNPSDLLHLLYLEQGDIMLTDDRIYDAISEAIEDFHMIKVNSEKSVTELMKTS